MTAGLPLPGSIRFARCHLDPEMSEVAGWSILVRMILLDKRVLRPGVGGRVDAERMLPPGRFPGRIGENRKAHCRSLPSVGMTRREGCFRWELRVGRGETAGPSTALRSGRDDNSVAVGTDATELPRQDGALQIPPFGRDDNSVAARNRCNGTLSDPATELSSRPKRSVVEGPAVSLAVMRLKPSLDKL